MEIRKFAQGQKPQAQVQQAQTQQTQKQLPIEEMTPGIEINELVVPNPLPETSIVLINQRIKDEYTAHFFYRNAANWCRNKNYVKAAAFFDGEASSELEHSKGLQEYLVDFNIQPVIEQTETNTTFHSLTHIIGEAYKMEYTLMQAYNTNSSELFASDLTTFDFLQEYRKIQKDAVVEYSDLLNALQLIDSNDKFQILYFEQTYF
jgi:ferritin